MFVVLLQLTKVGGGAFGNKADWIISAIQSALYKFKDEPLDVELIHFPEYEETYSKLKVNPADEKKE